jgi:hypothetical protein
MVRDKAEADLAQTVTSLRNTSFIYAASIYALYELSLVALWLAPALLAGMVTVLVILYVPEPSKLYGIALALVLFTAGLLLKSTSDYTINIPLAGLSCAAWVAALFLKPSIRRAAS